MAVRKPKPKPKTKRQVQRDALACHGVTGRATLGNVFKLLRILFQRQEKLMSEFDDIMAIVNAAKISLANIAQDILDIKNSIPPSGGMNAEQTAALRLSVTELNASLNALDLENPPPVTP